MRTRSRISARKSLLGLSVFALGLLAFSSPAFAEDVQETATPEDIRGQADRIRSLFQAAGRNGLVSFREQQEQNGEMPLQEVDAGLEEVADCMTLSPLFDGGQGSFATGHFVELATDRPETRALAQTLSDLIDPGYDGRPVAVDLTSAYDCGPSFLPWQVLASPEVVLDAQTEGELTNALASFDPNLMRLMGLRIATRAGLSGNTRLMRRVSDTLIDAGLHGQPHYDRDPEHVLLDALLRLRREPVSARARLSWLAERDGPEQLVAIDLLRRANAAPVAQSELRRLSDSPDDMTRLGAQHRLLTHAVEDADINQLAQMVTVSNNLTGDEESRARLTARLMDEISSEDPFRAVQALDVIDRMRSNGMEFSDALNAKVDVRIAELSASAQANKTKAQALALPDAKGPESFNEKGLSNYLETISNDLDTYQEVLSRG